MRSNLPAFNHCTNIYHFLNFTSRYQWGNPGIQVIPVCNFHKIMAIQWPPTTNHFRLIVQMRIHRCAIAQVLVFATASATTIVSISLHTIAYQSLTVD
jgi:hypothetical protein